MKPTRALVLGKFYPFHKGHMALIDFALTQADYVVVMVCAKPGEAIDPITRLNWVQETYLNNPNVIPILNYDPDLTDNSGNPSSHAVSIEWAIYIMKHYGMFDCVIGSEKYVSYMAEAMMAKPIIYDRDRTKIPISGTMIRENPQKYFEFLAEVVKPCVPISGKIFIKKK